MNLVLPLVSDGLLVFLPITISLVCARHRGSFWQTNRLFLMSVTTESFDLDALESPRGVLSACWLVVVRFRLVVSCLPSAVRMVRLLPRPLRAEKGISRSGHPFDRMIRSRMRAMVVTSCIFLVMRVLAIFPGGSSRIEAAVIYAAVSSLHL